MKYCKLNRKIFQKYNTSWQGARGLPVCYLQSFEKGMEKGNAMKRNPSSGQRNISKMQIQASDHSAMPYQITPTRKRKSNEVPAKKPI